MSEPAPTRMRQLMLPLCVFGLALLVRVAYVASIHDAYFFDHLTTEPAHYDAWGTAIVHGDAPVHLPFDEAPAYPYFIALVYAIAGHSVLAVALVQALLGALACAAIANVAERIASRRAGWIAGVLAACFAPLIYFTGQLEPATLAVTVTAGALAAMPFAPASQRRWLLASFAWSLAIVVRSELVIAAPFVIAHAWALEGKRLAARVAAVPALVLAGSLACNAAASGHPVLLTTGSGINLWLGNNAHADGVNPFIHGPLVAEAREVDAASHDAVDADARFRAKALAAIADDPAHAFGLAAKKLVWTFSRRELPNAADIQWQTRQSWVFQPPLFPLGFGFVFPLACAGAALVGRDWRRRLVLLAPIAIAVVTCVLLFTNARFRLVMMPSILVLAAIALARLRPLRIDRSLIRAAVALVAGALICWLDIAGVGRYRVPQIDANTGVLEHGAGHLAAAERYYSSAVRGDPTDAPSWIQLALTLEQMGQPDKAREVWRAALAAVPDDEALATLARSRLY